MLSQPSQQPPQLPKRPQRPPLLQSSSSSSSTTTPDQMRLSPSPSSDSENEEAPLSSSSTAGSSVDLSLDAFPLSSASSTGSDIPVILNTSIHGHDKGRQASGKSSDVADFFFLNKLTSLPNSNTTNMTGSSTRHHLQPLSLQLPTITPLSSKNNTGNIDNRGHTGYKAHTSNAPVKTSTKHANFEEINSNKFYIQLLENVNLEDQKIVFDLVDSLMKIRSENEKLKLSMWNKIDNLSSSNAKKNATTNTTTDHNSLMFDQNMTNDELENLLDEQRQYNSVLSQTIEEYQDSLDSILDALVKSNKDVGTEVLEAIKTGEKTVEDNSDEMWESWMQIVSAMDDVSKFDAALLDKMRL